MSLFLLIMFLISISIMLIIHSSLKVQIVLFGLFVLCIIGDRITAISILRKKKAIIKKILYIAFCGSLVLCVCGRGWIPGLFYPAKNFEFNLKNMEEPPLDIFIIADEKDNSFEKRFWAKAFTDNEHKIIRIKKISYKWEENFGEILKNGEVIEFEPYIIKSGFNDGWYKDENMGNRAGFYFGRFNPERLFRGKKIGDMFRFYLEVTYSFDNEPEEIVTLEYNVKVVKGKYQSFNPFPH